ncbi:MAG TPA: hypothetical protein VNO70_01985, partial [Blastocatellia bacterium]|nr:hypothetical protein [Blastocatellia bacterium]
MAAKTKPTETHPDHQRAIRLKDQLRAFATQGALKDIYDRHYHDSKLFEALDPADESESQSVLDWFLYDWFDERGKGVIDYFLEARDDLSARDREILGEWQDSIYSVFEIRSLADRSLRLRDLDNG